MQHFSIFFSKDSEVTLGTFAVDFGRRFGTKLGGVLVQKRRVSAAAAAAAAAGIDRRMFFYAAFFHFFLGIQKSR